MGFLPWDQWDAFESSLEKGKSLLCPDVLPPIWFEAFLFGVFSLLPFYGSVCKILILFFPFEFAAFFLF